MDKLTMKKNGILTKKWIYFLIALALLPIIFKASSFGEYLTYVTVRIMLLSLFAMSYDLIFGYTGMVSMGHALFMGVSAYVVAILMVRLDLDLTDAFIPIVVAMILGAVLGWAQGFLASSLGRLAVFLVTIATAETAFLIVLADPTGITNSENGISGIPRDTVLGIFNIKSEFNFYYFVLVIVVVSFFILRAITRMPFGDTILAIRENPLRAMYLGYNIRQYRIMVFVISSIFASLTGALIALHETSVAAEMFSPAESMFPFLFVLLGGAGTLIGAILGTTVMTLLMEIASDYFHYYLLFVSAAIILTVMFLPGGFYSLYTRFIEKKGQD